MAIINNNLVSNNFINNIKKQDINTKPKAQENLQNTKTFKEILENKEEPVMFSKHASMRLNARNIILSNTQIKRVEEGVKKAKQKGINDSLILVDNIALLVNVKNKVVVTAMDNNNENVYTNIDGAVIV